jgi:four helix bundle protein
MKVYQFPYEKLDVWQDARTLVKNIYAITKSFPSEEKFGLVNQVNRSAVSVASNLAEGCGRTSLKDQAHFSQMAYGSLMELSCQLTLAADLGMLPNDDFIKRKPELLGLANKLNALRKSQLARL